MSINLMFKHSKKTAIALENIMIGKGNETCFDCGDNEPLWASVNNGVLICTKCSSFHR